MAPSGSANGPASVRGGLLVFAVLAAAWPRVATADDSPVTAAVHVTTAGPSWRASALEQTLRRDLADGGLAMAEDRVDAADCAPADTRCIVARHRRAGVEVLWLASLEDERLAYQVHATGVAPVSRVGRGTIDLGDVDRAGLAQRVRRSFDRVTEPDGTLAVGTAEPERAAAAVALPRPDAAGVVVVFGVVALLLGVPLVFGATARGAGLSRVVRLASFRLTLLAWLALGLVGYALASWDGRGGSWSWILHVAGGLSWGWFGVTHLPLIGPSFRGLEQVEPRDLFRLLRAWLAVAVQRLGQLAVVYGPPLAVLVWACAAIGVPGGVTAAVVLPAGGLLIRFWFLSLVDNLSLRLDDRLVEGPASADNPWHRAVSGYFWGYVRRSGWPAPAELLDDVLFLPGRGDGVELYGGGLTHSRIVVGRQLLELALAPYDRPHDYGARREHALLWAEWNVGLVVPIDPDAPVAPPEERISRAAPLPGETRHEPLGQPPTLAGFVEPDAIDKRTTHRPFEDPTWLEWEPGDEVFDGTDPNDKDLLFGALVRELGAVERREGERHTLVRAAGDWLGRRAATRRVRDALGRAYAFLFARYPSLLGDAYAALNHARHHLVQYLAWRQWGRESDLTARAYVPDLEQRSAEILAAVDASSVRGRGASARQRLAWLSEFFRAPVRNRASAIARRVAVAGVVVAAVVGLGVAVVRAVDYHPVYLERLQEQGGGQSSAE